MVPSSGPKDGGVEGIVKHLECFCRSQCGHEGEDDDVHPLHIKMLPRVRVPFAVLSAISILDLRTTELTLPQVSSEMNITIDDRE